MPKTFFYVSEIVAACIIICLPLLSICPPLLLSVCRLPVPSSVLLFMSIPALPLFICRHAVWSICCPASVHLPACCMIHLLPCLCTSEGMLHDLSPVLPLYICRHAEWSISCLPFLSICQHAAWLISCPAFNVRLLTCCMIYLLPCLFCPSVSLMHATSPALPLLFVCWPAPDLSPALPFLPICRPDACYISCLSCPSDGMLHDQSPALPFLSIWRHAAWLISCPAFPVHLTACCMINLLPCLYCPSVSLLHD